ncbi:MAG: peptide deformylase [Oscillospiraceae bacterium]
MAERKIFNEKDAVLRAICRNVEHFDAHLAELLDDMHQTLDKAQGVGLAANQVGIRKRVFVLHNEDKRLEFVNPKITKTQGEVIDTEGCLSCPGLFGKVKRPEEIEIVAQDRTGKEFKLVMQGLNARIACHETDHLMGKLFKDIAFDLEQKA